MNPRTLTHLQDDYDNQEAPEYWEDDEDDGADDLEIENFITDNMEI